MNKTLLLIFGMFLWLFVTACLTVAVANASEANSTNSSDRKPTELVVGLSTTIATDYQIGDAAITDPKVCDYLIRENRTEVYLNARSSGGVMLTLWDLQGVKREVIPIQVSSVDFAILEKQVRAELPITGNIELRRETDQLLIEGEVDSESDLQRFIQFTEAHPEVKSRVILGKKALSNIALEIEKSISRPGITVREVRGQIVLEGIAYSPESSSHAEQVARLYSSDVLNIIEVRDTGRLPGKRPLIYLDVHFMEIKKSALKGFGIEWTPGAGGTNGNVLSQAIGFVSNLFPKIRWAREKGNGRVLEQPSVVVKSGERAELFSGTEIPYTTEQQVQFKKVGITVEAEPIAYGNDVDLKINVSVSAPSSGVNGGIDQRNISTSAYCKSGQSVVLGGLWNNLQTKTNNRIPQGSGSNSAIISLNASKDFQSRQSDFVIFVTPRIANSVKSADSVVQKWNAARHEEKIVTKNRSKKSFKLPLSLQEPLL